MNIDTGEIYKNLEAAKLAEQIGQPVVYGQLKTLEKLKENLKRCHPEMSEAEQEEIARKAMGVR